MTIQNRKPSGQPNGYRIIAKKDRAEIYLYGVIGQDFWGDGISAKMFADDLKKAGDVSRIDLRINSEGGDVFDGKAMYTLLTEHRAKVTTHVDGLAASAASYVAMAGNEIVIAEAAFMMIHPAWTITVGGATELREMADRLDTINETIADVYVARTGQDYDKVKKWMDAETWFTGSEAVETGFADRMVENQKVAATIRHPDRFHNLPKDLQPRRAAALATIEALKSC